MYEPANTGGLTHVRKTVTFTGAAGLGAVGAVAVFTTTGRVLVNYYTVYCSTSLVDAGGGAPATLAIGVTGSNGLFSDGVVIDPADGLTAGDWYSLGIGPTTGGAYSVPTAQPISANVILTVANEAINSGVLVIDFWYTPITDDGKLVAA